MAGPSTNGSTQSKASGCPHAIRCDQPQRKFLALIFIPPLQSVSGQEPRIFANCGAFPLQ
jgi:hypothetical protein